MRAALEVLWARILCSVAIYALVRLYGECAREDYEAECVACRASVLIRELRELRDDL